MFLKEGFGLALKSQEPPTPRELDYTKGFRMDRAHT